MMLGAAACNGGLPVIDSLYASWDFGRYELATQPGGSEVGIITISSGGTTTLSCITNAPHGLSVGQYANIANSPVTNFNGIFPVTSVIGPSWFLATYLTAVNNSDGSGNGRVSNPANNKNKFEDLSGNNRPLYIPSAGKAIYPGATPTPNGRNTVQTTSNATVSPPALTNQVTTFGLTQPFTCILFHNPANANNQFYMRNLDGTPNYFFINFLGIVEAVNFGTGLILPTRAAGPRMDIIIANGASSSHQYNDTTPTSGNAGTGGISSLLFGSNTDGSAVSENSFMGAYFWDKVLSSDEIWSMKNYGVNHFGVTL